MRDRDLSALKSKVRALPESPGVYLMKDRLGSILYVGKAKNLRRRVSSYFQPSRKLRIEQPKIAAMLDLIYDFQVIEVRSDSEALLLEGRLIKEWRPRYNTDFTDDKRFLLVKVDSASPLPKFRLVRFRDADNALYFGPFPHANLLRRTLHELRLRTGILLGDAHPVRQPDGQWRLYDDVRAELYGHPNCVSEADYQDRVQAACQILEGKAREWLSDLREAMQAAAEARNYERAADLRDRIKALEETTSKTRKFNRDPTPKLPADDALPLLRESLALKRLPRAIECFDISHISGSFCVASMVRFDNGKPTKAAYRRFKIKSFVGNDDFRAMHEVVGRRYQRLHDNAMPFPDLIVIDGGLGQVSAALAAFTKANLTPPPMIGLAKKHETILFPDQRPPLQLPEHHQGRLLLQRIRDEAHRFANTFNADLRRQKMRESALHHCPNLGPKRANALLAHFRSLQNLLDASPDQIAQIPGFGPQSAAAIHQWLHAHFAPPV